MPSSTGKVELGFRPALVSADDHGLAPWTDIRNSRPVSGDLFEARFKLHRDSPGWGRTRVIWWTLR